MQKMEIKGGQKFRNAKKGRELFAQEFADADALRDEFVERTSQRELAELSDRISQLNDEKVTVLC
jgi:hypothetical protein